MHRNAGRGILKPEGGSVTRDGRPKGSGARIMGKGSVEAKGAGEWAMTSISVWPAAAERPSQRQGDPCEAGELGAISLILGVWLDFPGAQFSHL